MERSSAAPSLDGRLGSLIASKLHARSRGLARTFIKYDTHRTGRLERGDLERALAHIGCSSHLGIIIKLVVLKSYRREHTHTWGYARGNPHAATTRSREAGPTKRPVGG